VPRLKTISDADVIFATGRVLQRIGPARFTLSDVALESGISPATLVQRFGSKRALMVAFAKAEAGRAAAPFDSARRSTASPLGALWAALAGVSEHFRSREEVANGLAVLLDDLTDDEMRAAAALHAETTETAIRTLLDEAVDAGEVAGEKTDDLAKSVQAAWNGAIIQWALRGVGSFDRWLAPVLAPLLGPQPSSMRRRSARRGRR
jgi:AcrR family transcriptional regulator